MMPFRVLALYNYAEKTNDIVRAVGLLRKHGVTVGFPMQTADGEVIFSVGKDTLTADQLLELLERGDLDADGVRRLVEALASGTSERRTRSQSHAGRPFTRIPPP